MSNEFSRRAFVATFLSGVGSFAWAKAPEVSLRPVARPTGQSSSQVVTKPAAAGPEALIEQAKLGGQVAYCVVDVKSGSVLEEGNARAGLPPASVTKSITALYALEALTPEYRFSTRLVGAGAVTNGVLNGDLILVGGGDPTLDTNGLARLAAKLKDAGVREVKGSLRSFGGALPRVGEIDPEQANFVAYNPTISGLNLNFNRVHFEWKRSGGSYVTTMDARSDKYRPDVRVARMGIGDQVQPVYLYRDAGGHDEWTVSRQALGDAGARWLPVRKPEAYAAEVLATFARSHGIILTQGGPVTSELRGTTLATEQSAPLHEILRDMLKFSNNLTAEVVGLTSSIARRSNITSLKESAQEMSAWARTRLGMQGVRFVDHSGLGEASRITATELARAMGTVHRQRSLQPLLRPFTMRHENGNVNDNHPIKVLAKTGTLYFVSTLSGFMTTANGTELAFAILTANEQSRTKINRTTGAPPDGASAWNKRSRTLQQKLIERWGDIYAS